MKKTILLGLLALSSLVMFAQEKPKEKAAPPVEQVQEQQVADSFTVKATAVDWQAILEVIDNSSAEHLKVKQVQAYLLSILNPQVKAAAERKEAASKVPETPSPTKPKPKN